MLWAQLQINFSCCIKNEWPEKLDMLRLLPFKLGLNPSQTRALSVLLGLSLAWPGLCRPVPPGGLSAFKFVPMILFAGTYHVFLLRWCFHLVVPCRLHILPCNNRVYAIVPFSCLHSAIPVWYMLRFVRWMILHQDTISHDALIVHMNWWMIHAAMWKLKNG